MGTSIAEIKNGRETLPADRKELSSQDNFSFVEVQESPQPTYAYLYLFVR
jgi:hypothetical protein